MSRNFSARFYARALLSTCLATSAMAQDVPFELDTIVLNSDRVGNTVLDVPANVTVVDGEEIEDRQINDMQDLARGVPGVAVGRQTSSADPFSTFGGFNIRGVGGNRVAIQVDGSRVAERIIDGTRDYLDFNFTKQVEIVRGPASVLWGADALGGLVAFETIDPEDLLLGRDQAINVKGGYDSYDNSTNVSLSFGRQFSPDLSVLFGLARSNANEPVHSNARDDGGIYGCPRNLDYGATPCGSFDLMSEESTRALLKVVWTPSDQHRLEFSADILDRNTAVDQNYILGPVYSSFTGNPTGEIIDRKTRDLDLTRQRYGIEHTYAPGGGFFDEVKTVFAYTPHGYERTGIENSTSAGGDRIVTRDELKYSEDFFELDIQGSAEFAHGSTRHQLVMGFDGDIAKTDYSRRDIEENLTTGVINESRAGGFNFANATTTRADIYIQDRIIFGSGKFELTPGLRYATYDIDPRPDADYQIVPGDEPRRRTEQRLLKSLGAIYNIDDNWSVWGKYGEGFKMPTAQQLYTSLPGSFFTLLPAPNLKPEEVDSYEVGLRFQQANGFFAINGFNAKYSEFIQSFYNIPGTSSYTYRNISEVDIWGIEASGGWALSDRTSMTFSAAWQEGRQRVTPTSDETPHTLPPLTGTLGVSHFIPQYNLTVEGVVTAAAAVTETESEDDFKPAGYGLLDLYAKWQVTENGSFNLGVQNVFDKRYFTANAATYSQTASDSVARANPIELQTGPGRTFNISFDMTF